MTSVLHFDSVCHVSDEHYQDGSFWNSKLADFRTCPRLYKLKHIDKVPQPVLPSGDLEFGTAMHLSLNTMLSGGAGLSIFSTYWESIKDKPIQYGRFDWAQHKDIAERLLTRFEKLHKKHFEPVSMEERISMRVGEHRIEGTPDFVGKYRGVPSIVDFKTSGSKYDKRKIYCDEQMPLYAELAKRVHGFEAKQLVYVVFIKGEVSIQTLTRELTGTERTSIVQNVVETCDDLAARKAWPRNPDGCLKYGGCPYFKHCYGDVS